MSQILILRDLFRLMNILIAGSNGQLGSNLVKLFSKNNTIISVSRKNTKIKKKNNIIKINYDDLLFLSIKPDIIINCIATHYFSKQKKYSNYYSSNVKRLKELIKLHNFFKSKLFINFSSISLYKSIIIGSLNEKSKTKKNDYYCFTKNMGEKYLEKSGVNYVNIRLPGIICEKKISLRPWTNRIFSDLKRNKKIEIFNHNNRYNRVIDSREIFRILLKLIKKKNIKKTFNLTASNPIKIIDLIQFIKKNIKSKSNILIKKTFNENSSLIDNRKISNFLKTDIVSVKKILKRNYLN